MRYMDVSSAIFRLLGIAGILVFILVKVVHVVCFRSVGALYNSGMIDGRMAGKFFYFLFFAVAVGGIAVLAVHLGS